MSSKKKCIQSHDQQRPKEYQVNHGDGNSGPLFSPPCDEPETKIHQEPGRCSDGIKFTLLDDKKDLADHRYEDRDTEATKSQSFACRGCLFFVGFFQGVSRFVEVRC